MLGAMSLSLIVGPPNSGKAGEVLARLKAALDRDPVLIVPTLDDADRFERELCEGAGNGDPVLGVSIRTFERLFEDVAQATGTPLPPTLSDEQRLYAVRLATRRANPRILGRSAARPGFARALASLLDEAQAACIDPAGLAASAAAVSPRAPTCARSQPSTRHMPRHATPSAMETTTWRPPEPPRRCERPRMPGARVLCSSTASTT